MTAVSAQLSSLAERRYNFFLFSEEYALGGHGNSAEMPALISERFADHGQFRLALPFT